MERVAHREAHDELFELVEMIDRAAHGVMSGYVPSGRLKNRHYTILDGPRRERRSAALHRRDPGYGVMAVVSLVAEVVQ